MTTDINKYKPKTYFKSNEIAANITKFRNSGNTHAKLGQRLVLSIAQDLDKTSNMHYVWDLFENMPVNVSASAFKKWLIAHAKVKEPTNDKERDKSKHGLCFDNKAKTDLTTGADNPWWNFKPNEVRGFDLFKAVQTAVKNAQKAETRELEEGQTLKGEDNIPEPLLNDLERLIKKYDTNKSNVA